MREREVTVYSWLDASANRPPLTGMRGNGSVASAPSVSSHRQAQPHDHTRPPDAASEHDLIRKDFRIKSFLAMKFTAQFFNNTSKDHAV